MIVLAGTIGAGKTSLTTLLANHLGSKAIYESVSDNPILPLFYDDPKKYAFLLQIYFLNKRLDNIKNAQENKLDVIDRSIFEDALLFQLNADLGRSTETEVQIYKSLLTNMMEKLTELPSKDPGLLIHVRVSFDTMLDRIQKRGRSFEQISVHPDLYTYYEELNKRYEAWYASYDRGPKMEIDGDKYDFVESKPAADEVLKQIDAKLFDLGSLVG
ncbi:deoxynucleoside kinase [Oenococcus kitaharae]|uniref:Deoxyadenosine kinase n=1 Tax=Oenococcus kitaharae DSM 17330 TaxID=1045004 RepID=G9WIF1_9LACO|nr:deoxynucleoside kinase [Oenococcus kitaharae]EHN58963.1 Deoxyadenosine kinase [Oenococcus kitaharae DSM 17330]OEY81726.1 deoxyadenosine kinase [Oenococcus kitaharae]OEY83957.1 deoxyadenosine kinase [Oenococcus kitaharae]OEY85687.1 deoxyadenosine kinase [Oenococcus kitaharae]